MGRDNLIDMIGKLFVDEALRKRFIENAESEIDSFNGLSNKEKEYLKNMKCVIISWIQAACITYDKDDKRS